MNDFTIYGILYSCPVGERNQNCPIKSFDQISFLDKVILFEDLSEEEKIAIVREHRRCSSKRSNK